MELNTLHIAMCTLFEALRNFEHMLLSLITLHT